MAYTIAQTLNNVTVKQCSVIATADADAASAAQTWDAASSAPDTLSASTAITVRPSPTWASNVGIRTEIAAITGRAQRCC